MHIFQIVLGNLISYAYLLSILKMQMKDVATRKQLDPKGHAMKFCMQAL